jgi:hypothetical protein
MELNTNTSHATSGAKVTSHYWGYRELSADEVCAVSGGGDFSGDGFDSSGPNGCGSNSNATGNQAAQSTQCQNDADARAVALGRQVMSIGLRDGQFSNFTNFGTSLGLGIGSGQGTGYEGCGRSDR